MEPAMHMVSTLAVFVSLASIKGAALATLVFLIQKLAGRYLSARTRYLLWFPVVAALLTPVGLEFTLPAGLLPANAPELVSAVLSPESGNTQSPVPGFPQDRGGANGDSGPSPDSARAGSVTSPVESALAWPDVLVYTWCAGVLLVLGAVAGSCRRFSRSIHRAVPAPDELQELLKDCMVQTRCGVPVRLLQSAEVQVPMIAGLFKPVLLLPAGIEQYLTRAQLRHVFIHELMHLRHGDIVSNWIVALTQALHWFNPAVWFAFYCMRHDRELACDAATLRHLAPADRSGYGHTLLQLNDLSPRVPAPAVALGILGSPSHLQRRIHMLVKSAQPRKLQSGIVTALLLVLAAAAFSQPVPIPAVVQQSTAPSVQPTAAEPVAAEPIAATPVATPPVAVVASAPGEKTPLSVEEPVLPAPGPAMNDRQLVAQADVAPVPDAFALPAEESPIVVAAVTTVQPEPVAPEAEIPATVLQMTEELASLKRDLLAVIEVWNTNALACAARKEDSFFGTFSKPCRETRAVQIRGEVFRFVYACQVLGAQQLAQQEALGQEQGGMSGVAASLRANAQELETFCAKSTYAEAYPGFIGMIADAAALKYYNPWPRTAVRYTYDNPNPVTFSDPTIASRIADMPARP
jgi:beta-lactamase regulating signal transducer with metallopeptidase domain